MLSQCGVDGIALLTLPGFASYVKKEHVNIYQHVFANDINMHLFLFGLQTTPQTCTYVDSKEYPNPVSSTVISPKLTTTKAQ